MKQQQQAVVRPVVQEEGSGSSSTIVTVDWSEVIPAHGRGSLPVANSERVLFWTESMDMALVRAVRDSLFDFTAVAQRLQELQERRQFSEQFSDMSLTEWSDRVLTADVCRLRWAELDADRWCVPMPNAAPTTLPNYKSTWVAAGAPGNEYQPMTYDELVTSVRTTASTASYLKKPISLPSVYDTIDKDDEDDEDTVQPMHTHTTDVNLEDMD